uniref:RNA-directed DNA polymerase, eukaryota, reverse transcriptase zinc-binding domain protein n=1 Tax=Tanacetum cinerariifolium TaxID=118510 RepID=A0A6L2K1I7_TANCI|nr:RNA-directed DNA polymerase, eukaryota, reverse transcriptase zinc-binding domain protein [Tanacetum cinerariifolium]
MAIRGVLVDGIWTESPELVKNEFLYHFKNRFDKPQSPRIMIDMDFPIQLSLEQQEEMECNITRKEIKRAVWDCGTDKSPGPDGFTFGFYRKFWCVIENGVVEAVNPYFQDTTFPKGGNASFIALIPKTNNANMVKDFRPITLTGSLYKIIAKILAKRLVSVLGNIVSEGQSAFVANRQILDGPFILNELVHWCKRKKKQSMIFKVDFEKAYDSLWKAFLSVQRVVDAGLFTGITICPSLQLSHLFYADDVVFLGQWSEVNRNVIVKVLDCFYRASGLHINMNKRTKVGGIMSRAKSWKEIVNNFDSRIPRGGIEQVQFIELQRFTEGIVFANSRDRWSWSLEGSGVFSVASIRRIIDDKFLPAFSSKTRWVSMVPIKVNIIAWKEVESSNHLFFACHFAREILSRIALWWDVPFIEMSSYEEWLLWISTLRCEPILHMRHYQATKKLPEKLINQILGAGSNGRAE